MSCTVIEVNDEDSEEAKTSHHFFFSNSRENAPIPVQRTFVLLV